MNQSFYKRLTNYVKYGKQTSEKQRATSNLLSPHCVVCMYIVTFFNVCYQISMIMYWEQEVTTQVCMNLSVCNNQHGHFSSPKCGKISNLSTSSDHIEHIWYGFLFTFCRISNLSPKHCRKLSEFVSKIKEESQVLQSPE